MGLLIRWWHRLTARWQTRAIPKHQRAATPHTLDALCAQFGAQYLRSTFTTGEVQITLVRGPETLAGRGPTTDAAIVDVTRKATQLWGTSPT